MHPAFGAQPTLARKDCFFGLHFDLHPTAEDTALGRDLTDAMVEHLLQAVHPDFIQYDSKGHPGYLGFPSKTGMAAPGIVQDSLAIWRRVTARNGVALYNHFSGVLDGLAVAKHPQWACVDSEGVRSPQETSLFSPYEQELMIPELREVALKYDLDGSWVDGDCWAVTVDYCEAAQQKFREKTGIQQVPKKSDDPGWIDFLEIQRQQFREYVAKYVDALHRAKPGYQITSNWMYSTFVPEQPVLPLDYLSGDVADHAAIRQARMEARYFASCGMPWDLMSWGFDTGPGFKQMSHKPVTELEQEAAVVIAQGGAFQLYYTPTRAGWIDDRIVNAAAAVGKFCRARQQASHRSQTIPEAGVIFSGKTLYRTADHPFGPWGSATRPAEGALDLLLACGYSVDIVPDWCAAESVAQYPLIILPDWSDVGSEMVHTLMSYVANGGNLLICGAENTQLFAPKLNLHLKSPIARNTFFVADDTGFAEIDGSWLAVDAPASQIVAHAYRAMDTRKDLLPLGIRATHGKGKIVISPGPLFSAYGASRSSILRSTGRSLAAELHQPAVTIDGDHPMLEIVQRKKNSQMYVHLINTAGVSIASEFRDREVICPTGLLQITIRLPNAPSQVTLEPAGTVLTGKYESGTWQGSLPDLEIHSILKITGNV